MLSFLDDIYIGTKIRITNFVNELRNDETGVSNFVATILLIVIVVALCALFWSLIKDWFIEQWEKIVNKSGTVGG